MRSSFRLALSFAAIVPAFVCAAAPVHAAVVERVVAVIGDRPILMSELRTRARPFLVEIARKMPVGPQQNAAESEIFKELLQKMIDDELEDQAAQKAHISVSSDEIDTALRQISGAQGLTVSDLVKNALRSGLSEQDYREELRRQLLEGKMLQLRVKGRVRITEEDVKGMYERQLREERKRREYQARWIVLRIYSGSSPAAIAQRQDLARDLVVRARKGEDFGSLAQQYSDDSPTRATGGDLGIRAPQGSPQVQAKRRESLAPELDAAVANLEKGEVSDPIKLAGALVILQLVDRQASRYTSYDAAKNEMVQRLQTEILDKAKRKWLDELKAHTHLDVRL